MLIERLPIAAVLCVGCLVGMFTPTALGAEQSYPAAASKKGLQVELVDDALALGIKHAALNFNLASLIDPRGETNNPSWALDGQVFHFQKSYLEQMDRAIKPLSDAGVLVNLILLVYASADPAVNQALLHPGYATNAPNRLSAFNTATGEGQRWLRAALEFTANRWSRLDEKFGRVVGYIVGNEVNSHWWWSNMGRVSMKTFANAYLEAVRLVHAAVRKQSASARIYLSLEHHWNIRYPAGDDRQAFPARVFLDYFGRRAREQGDFDWHVAFHPYPENLFEPRFWLDRSATSEADTPRITFKNIEVLPAYLARPELRYINQVRRVILSEQGFHTPAGTAGETVQAAAFCYAYKKIERLEGVDAFILHRHVDHSGEGGLLLGLRRNKPEVTEARPKKKIYECFRLADTPQWEEAFEFALPVIGLKSWEEAK